MFRSFISYAALTAATVTLGLSAAHAQQAHAQDAQADQYDGYCYVQSDDMAANAAKAPCMSGEYYAYTDGYRPAPRAPAGYEVEYFTHRPSRDVYSRVYNASTLTANFDPGARSHFGAGNSQYADRGATDGPYSDVQPGAVNPDNRADNRPDDRVAGWRDDGGHWHEGQPSALGWRDEAGHWHEGQVAAYGWQDNDGNWHDNAASNAGY
jgi:hypothetical protein